MEENKFPEKRICESSWHEEIELEPFEECPICGSKSFHRVLKYIDGKWK
ncbi:MAG: hypothetical protein ACOCP4_05515 [Candidatus Woesearchaeota archaeon]